MPWPSDAMVPREATGATGQVEAMGLAAATGPEEVTVLEVATVLEGSTGLAEVTVADCSCGCGLDELHEGQATGVMDPTAVQVAMRATEALAAMGQAGATAAPSTVHQSKATACRLSPLALRTRPM